MIVAVLGVVMCIVSSLLAVAWFVGFSEAYESTDPYSPPTPTEIISYEGTKMRAIQRAVEIFDREGLDHGDANIHMTSRTKAELEREVIGYADVTPQTIFGMRIVIDPRLAPGEFLLVAKHDRLVVEVEKK